MMRLHGGLSLDNPHLWGLPQEPNPIGMVLLTSGRTGSKYTATCDAIHAEMLMEYMCTPGEDSINVPAHPYILVRNGWLTEWDNREWDQPDAWVPATEAWAADADGATS